MIYALIGHNIRYHWNVTYEYIQIIYGLYFYSSSLSDKYANFPIVKLQREQSKYIILTPFQLLDNEFTDALR